jgi:hypothetical protein
MPSPPPSPDAGDEPGKPPRERPVSLGTRAVPLVSMLERAIAGRSDLMWDRG